MLTAAQVMKTLEAMGSEQTRKTFIRHGAPPDALFGVKVGDLKTIVKEVKKDHALALELYATGNSDAMYLAGLIADDAQMTKKDLQAWVEAATWYMIADYTVPWVAAGGPHGWAMGLKWIESKKPLIASAGWFTLSSVVSITPDDDLDLPGLKKLLDRVKDSIHDQPGRVPYAMNNFVIAVGAFVAPLNPQSVAVAKAIGKVNVDMGETACKVPDAVQYLAKMKDRGIGKKRKTVKC